MTITEQELTYIAEHWLPHQTITPHSWGIDLNHANPETYLAILRGGVLSFSSSYPYNLYLKYITNITDFSPYPSSYTYSRDIKYFTETILYDWITYLGISLPQYYSIEKYSQYAIKQKVHNCLIQVFSTQENSNRIYTLE